MKSRARLRKDADFTWFRACVKVSGCFSFAGVGVTHLNSFIPAKAGIQNKTKNPFVLSQSKDERASQQNKLGLVGSRPD
ncbi:MAG: hypothetical protein LBV44_02405, partial [Methylobacillus sp.]|nr:hypothetical protein [Methylobacillus sp.]